MYTYVNNMPEHLSRWVGLGFIACETEASNTGFTLLLISI